MPPPFVSKFLVLPFLPPFSPWLFSLPPPPAVSLISNLLQVSVRKRFSVGKALGHPWLQVRHTHTQV